MSGPSGRAGCGEERPALVDLPNGPASTLGCLKLALLLVTDARGRYVVMVQGPGEHHPGLEVEIAGLPVADAQAVLGELDRLRLELNVYRGHLLDVTLSPMGAVVLTFAAPPELRRHDVVLPDTVLTRVERHALGVAAHRAALLAAGQHLKRGLLLYGPPGTGKTHTTRYLLGQMTGYTRLVLTGRALIGVGAVTELARDLQPAVVVLEDVDLVAEDRSHGPASSPVLFDLLDAMDSAAPTQPALPAHHQPRRPAQRPEPAPARGDVAEIELRRRRADALALTGGGGASFLKELIRRSVLEALHDAPRRGGAGGAGGARRGRRPGHGHGRAPGPRA